MMHRIAAAALLGLLLVVTLARPATAVGPSLEALRAIPLVDQDDRPFTLRQTLGRIVVLDFVFTGCGDVCPSKTADLATVQAALPAELRAKTLFLSISVDPDHDFPAALRAYAESRGVDLASWRFLTGTPDAIGAVAAFYAAARPGAPLTEHTGTVQLFDPEGQSVIRYVGAPLDAPRLTADIAALAAR